MNGTLSVRGGDELSSPEGPSKSPVPLPYGNNLTTFEVDVVSIVKRNEH